MNIQIKNRWDGQVLFAGNYPDQKAAVEAAVKAGVDLYAADLSGADLSGAHLAGAELFRANLSKAHLYAADLYGAHLSRADLSGANLSRATLAQADLCFAKLYETDLSGANLSMADLCEADLSAANLSGANLRGTDLSGATGANPFRSTPLLMLLDQPGPIRAYKLVTADGDGPYNGGIRYKVREEPYEVADADCNPLSACGSGINLATLDWCMREWRPGYRILIAEFRAGDIAAIPTGTDGKFRVHRCRIVGEKDLAEIGLVEKPAQEEAARPITDADVPDEAVRDYRPGGELHGMLEEE